MEIPIFVRTFGPSKIEIKKSQIFRFSGDDSYPYTL